MDTSNIIIQGLWIGGALSVIEQLCIKSFLANGHEFHLYTYGKVANIPSGTTVLDGNDIISQDNIFKDSRGGVATFADYFRYVLLLKKGGWWVDMDVFCLRPFDIDSAYSFASELRPDGSQNIANCIFKAPAGAPLLQHCKELIEARLAKLHQNKKKLWWHDRRGTSPIAKIRRFVGRNWIPAETEVQWGEFGPWFLNAQAKAFHLEKYIAAPSVFCPIPFYECYKLICKPTNDIIMPSDSLSIHYWNEMFHLIYFKKDAIFNENSIVEQLKSRYL